MGAYGVVVQFGSNEGPQLFEGGADDGLGAGGGRWAVRAWEHSGPHLDVTHDEFVGVGPGQNLVLVHYRLEP